MSNTTCQDKVIKVPSEKGMDKAEKLVLETSNTSFSMKALS